MNPGSTLHAEQKTQLLDDNARKFVTEPLSNEFLKAQQATDYLLVTDWLETNEGSETKVVRKEYHNGAVQLLLIKKVTTDDVRTSQKTPITSEEYTAYLGASRVHVEKRRYEFTLSQNGIEFIVKYDEFQKSDLRIIEVEGKAHDDQALFNPIELPGRLTEVTGDTRYYGYRVASMLLSAT